MRRALITGVTGQDGSYLAELLLGKGYEVHGLIRRASTFNTGRIDHLYRDPHEPDARLFLHYGDLTDGARLVTLMREIDPDEVYNLGAQSHVRVSFDEPEHTGDSTGARHDAPARGRPDVRRALPLLPGVELGDVRRRARRRRTSRPPFHPRSPYGVAKVYAYWATSNYREAYGLFAVNGILFNHESPRRGETFVTRKITRAVARIKAGPRRPRLHGQPRRRARLGLRPGVRRGHVADAPGRRARRLRAGHRQRRSRCATSWRRRSAMPGSTGRSTCASTSATCGPTEVDALCRRRRQGRAGARLEADRRRDRSSRRSWSTPTSRRSRTRAGRGSTGRAAGRLAGDAMTTFRAGSARPRRHDVRRRPSRHGRLGRLAPPRGRRVHRPPRPHLVRARPARPRRRRSTTSPRSGPATSCWPPPRSAASSPTTPTRWSSSPTTCASRPTSWTRRSSSGSSACSSSARPASTPGSRRSRSARTPCSPARSSRPTTPTRSPRSPGSSASRPSAASTACRGSPRCRPTSTARATTSRRPAATCCPR